VRAHQADEQTTPCARFISHLREIAELAPAMQALWRAIAERPAAAGARDATSTADAR
jgi:hypothetical protein